MMTPEDNKQALSEELRELMDGLSANIKTHMICNNDHFHHILNNKIILHRSFFIQGSGIYDYDCQPWAKITLEIGNPLDEQHHENKTKPTIFGLYDMSVGYYRGFFSSMEGAEGEKKEIEEAESGAWINIIENTII